MEKHNHHFLKEDTIHHVVSMFRAIADPTRLKLLHLLSEEECSVNHIAEILDMSQSAISHQLRTLRQANLVRARREGQHIYYSCIDEHVITLIDQAITHAEHE
ncbi:ArsR/SmtB family transcription factor [Evansella halocellulosilytica]|uniref:ArsR/SmtB family transcription factor n=1 Tax=Evansella halocellulosilytica TaxID=2011013 RepID=UPI000BB7146B|nr:metalloregulator ArsR/SmtB family transcription factor [Evansella halocellulosilytica]